VPTTIHRDPYKWVMNKVHKTSSAVIEPSKVKDARESKGSPKVAESSKLLQPMSNGDQVGNIEALLAEVRDPSQ
jgi:hypothetical protein